MDRIREITEQLKVRNYECFDEFYDLTSKILYVSIHNIVKNRNAVEDLMQDTYMKFLENIDKCEIDKYPQAYLIQIGKNNAINYYNKKKHQLIDDDIIDIMVEQKEENRVELDILNKLQELEKEIVTLHIVGALTFKEISVIVSKPLGTVLWIYNKAIKFLQKEVNK